MSGLAPSGNALYVSTLNCLKFTWHERIPFFLSCLDEACQTSPPPYGEDWYGEIYYSLARDPSWLANLFVRYAQEECKASKRLGALRVYGREILSGFQDRLLSRHQADESHHSVKFLELSERVFQQREVVRFKQQLRESNVEPLPLLSRTVTGDELCTEIIQINIGEVKNRIHLELMKVAALAHCAEDALEEVIQIADRLIRDEISHIYYTALIMEDLVSINDQSIMREIYIRQFALFNQRLRMELGR